MQVHRIDTTTFNAHGARNLRELMNRLYKEAYNVAYEPYEPDIIEFSTTMRDGVEVRATASFDNGSFIKMSFPYEFTKYRTQFCNKLFETYNNAVSKGKASKLRINR